MVAPHSREDILGSRADIWKSAIRNNCWASQNERNHSILFQDILSSKLVKYL